MMIENDFKLDVIQSCIEADYLNNKKIVIDLRLACGGEEGGGDDMISQY